VKKNKVAAPFRVAEFDIMYNEGISKVGDVLDIAVETGIVEKRGSFYAYGDTRLGQGRENVKQFMRENLGITGEIENRVREAGSLPRFNSRQPGDDGASGLADETSTEFELIEMEA
jgi:recombination protein RecA